MAERRCMVELYPGEDYERRCSRLARRSVRLPSGELAELCYQHLRVARRRGAFLLIDGWLRFFGPSLFAADSEAIR